MRIEVLPAHKKRAFPLGGMPSTASLPCQPLVPVLEDFKRALSQENSDSDNDEGINLIFNKFNETLKSQGLTEVEVNIGDIFDPEIHEAISQIPATEDDQKGKIIDIIQGGYKLGDSIINFPKVVVAQ